MPAIAVGHRPKASAKKLFEFLGGAADAVFNAREVNGLRRGLGITPTLNADNVALAICLQCECFLRLRWRLPNGNCSLW